MPDSLIIGHCPDKEIAAGEYEQTARFICCQGGGQLDVFIGIVKNLVIIIILSSLLELLLPQGTIRPLVRFCIGLFILIAILNPVLNALYKNENYTLNFWDFREDKSLQQKIQENGADLQKDITNTQENLVKEKMQGQINAVAALVPGVDEVASEITMGEGQKIEKVQLIIKAEPNKEVSSVHEVQVNSGNNIDYNAQEQEQVIKKMKTLLNNFYGLDGVQLDIRFEGGRNHAG